MVAPVCGASPADYDGLEAMGTANFSTSTPQPPPTLFFNLDAGLGAETPFSDIPMPPGFPDADPLERPLTFIGTKADSGIDSIPTLTAKTLTVLERRLADSPGTAQFANLTFTSIPEPGAWLLIGLGTAFVLWRRKRSLRI